MANELTAPPTGRLLVVDDNEANREVLERRLVRRGYHVLSVSSGQAALDAVLRERWDAVLLDIEMPEVSGLDVLTKIRATHSKAELPVIMATARTGSEDMVEAFRLGANDYVTKPLDFLVVLARLEFHLAIQREVRAASTPSVLLTTTEDIPAGTLLEGRYRVGNPLGQGGFAVVYDAIQESTGMAVAIKIMRAHRLMHPDAQTEVARFELEMRVIASAAHPAIVRLIDSGALQARTRGTMEEVADTMVADSSAPAASEPLSQPPQQQIPYIVMEKLVGPTLQELLAKDGTIELEQAIDFLLPILDGVFTMHEQGIVHRDAKPSNIVLSTGPNGQVEPKILDFGIAKLAVDGQPSLTRTDVLVGTPDYMSPEQARAENVGPASDQYTLASVLYECLNGCKPHLINQCAELLVEIGSGNAAKNAMKRNPVPDALRPVLEKALAATPEERFASVREFGEALLPMASDAGRARWQVLLDPSQAASE